jgi:hypothetical protein
MKQAKFSERGKLARDGQLSNRRRSMKKDELHLIRVSK